MNAQQGFFRTQSSSVNSHFPSLSLLFLFPFFYFAFCPLLFSSILVFSFLFFCFLIILTPKWCPYLDVNTARTAVACGLKSFTSFILFCRILLGSETMEKETDLIAANHNEEHLTPEQRKREKRKITKNVYIISLGFLFLFTAFQSLQNLQSSLNKVEGLGFWSLCVIYAALILSCILVPPFAIGRLGCKWTLVFSMTGYVLYTVANYYARWWTLIPASFIIGKWIVLLQSWFLTQFTRTNMEWP